MLGEACGHCRRRGAIEPAILIFYVKCVAGIDRVHVELELQGQQTCAVDRLSDNIPRLVLRAFRLRVSLSGYLPNYMKSWTRPETCFLN